MRCVAAAVHLVDECGARGRPGVPAAGFGEQRHAAGHNMFWWLRVHEWAQPGLSFFIPNNAIKYLVIHY